MTEPQLRTPAKDAQRRSGTGPSHELGLGSRSMFCRFCVVAGIALSQWGCSELQLQGRGAAGVSPCSFWPPPPGSAIWLVNSPAADQSLRSVADELESRLRESGYSDQRWYPIGLGNSHGFAVTTRLEQIGDGAGKEPRERWSRLYAEAATLRWLLLAREPLLPRPGRYRIFLVSYSDLPTGHTSNAPIWNEETLMDWPNAEHASSTPTDEVRPRSTMGYQLWVHEYEYAWDGAGARGRLLARDAAESGNEALVRPPLVRALAEEAPPAKN